MFRERKVLQYRIALWWRGFRWFRRCQRCGCRGAQHYHQGSAYVNEASNWVSLCRPCSDENDTYWNDMWADYYSGCL